MTVVDPREIKATSKQRRALRCRARYHQGVHDAGANDDDRDVHGGETADGVDVLRSGATGETRNATDAASADSGGSADRETRSVYAPSAASLRHAAEEVGATVGVTLPSQLTCLFDEAFLGAHAGLWDACSAVVGLHPDQATEVIVDYALAAKKAFAVVPCCVFPKSNVHRRTADGTPVVSHEQFCRYLAQKHPAIQSTTLSIEGRNTLLFYRPDSNASGEGQVAEVCTFCDTSS